jgi:cytochrome c oxidase assembly protein subunit 15
MLDDATTAQFDHRMLGYAVFVFAVLQALAAWRAAPPALARRTVVLAGVATLQAGLGIAALVLAVPTALALAHQGTALILFGLAVWHWRAAQIERGGVGLKRSAGQT